MEAGTGAYAAYKVHQVTPLEQNPLLYVALTAELAKLAQDRKSWQASSGRSPGCHKRAAFSRAARPGAPALRRLEF